MKKVLFMLMAAVALMACEGTIPGGDSGVPTNDVKAINATTSDAVSMLGKDAATVEKALLAAGFIKRDGALKVPARMQQMAAKAPKVEGEATEVYYVYGFPSNYREMEAEELLEYQEKYMEKGGVLVMARIIYVDGKMVVATSEFAMKVGQKTNLLYTGISDKLYSSLPKTDSINSRWYGETYALGQEKDFTDHAAFSATIAAAKSIEAYESGYSITNKETLDGLFYSGMWRSAEYGDEESEYPYVAGMMSVAIPSAVMDDPNPHGVDIDFDITVSNITASSATISLKPSKNDVPYYWTIILAEYLDQYSATEIAQQLMANEEEEGNTYEDLEDIYIMTGPDSYTYKDLMPQTNYAVIAFPVDKELNVLNAPELENFTTSELVVKETVNVQGVGDLYDYTSVGFFAVEAIIDEKGAFLQFTFDAEDIEGEFSEENLNQMYGGWVVFDAEKGDAYPVAEMSATGALSIDGQMYTFAGEAVCTNAVKYVFELTCPVTESAEAPKKHIAPRKTVKHLARK